MPFILILSLVIAGCSTFFPENDPYLYSSVKTTVEASKNDEEPSEIFTPSLGIPKRTTKRPWVVKKSSYFEKGLSKHNGLTLWQQIEKAYNLSMNEDIKVIKGNVAEKIEIAMGNVKSLPTYLEKPLVSSHNNYMASFGGVSKIKKTAQQIIDTNREISALSENQLSLVHNLRETVGEIKILEARLGEVQASLPAKQIRIFIDNLAAQVVQVNEELKKIDKKLSALYKNEKDLRNNLIHMENALRLKQGDQLFFLNDIADNLISNLPVVGSGWVQWGSYMLNESESWNHRDDSLGWAIASLKDEKLLSNVSIDIGNNRSVSFENGEIKEAMSWYYGLYSNGLEASNSNCSIANNLQSHRDGLICSFIPGRNNCKTAAISRDIQVVADYREKGFVMYLEGRTANIPKVGVILGIVDEDHYHVAEYDSVSSYFENELKIENKDYSASVSKVLFIPKKCVNMPPDVLHRNLVEHIGYRKSGLVLEMSLRGQPVYVPVHQVRMEHIPLLMKNGQYSRTNQAIDAGFVANLSSKFLNSKTDKVILTKATINTFPKGYISGEKTPKDNYMSMTFMYLLELNEKDEIISGSWYVPFTKKDLGIQHRWFHVMKPTAIFYPQSVTLPKVGSLASFFSGFIEDD